MTTNYVLIDIKNITFLVELFSDCVFDGTDFISNSQKMFGDPLIMGNRGKNMDEIHVMMSWSAYNVRAIAKVLGNIDPDTNKLILYLVNNTG